MAKRQTRPLTPAEAVRQGRKLIAERRRQEAARKAAMQPEAVAQPEPISEPICQPNPPPAAWEGGAEADAGKPVPQQDQRVEVVSSAPESPDNSSAAELTIIFAATIEAPQSVQILHEPGAWRLTDLRARQCRFACTADDAPLDQHRFCGRRTHVGPGNLHGSWCDEHLPRVWGTGSVSERNAHHVTKDVRRFG